MPNHDTENGEKRVHELSTLHSLTIIYIIKELTPQLNTQYIVKT